MTSDANTSRRGREPAPRRPLKKLSARQPSDAVTLEHFGDLSEILPRNWWRTPVRSITDPHELLDWVVEEAKRGGRQVSVSEAFVDLLDELINVVRIYGFLPNGVDGELLRLRPVFDALSAPSAVVQANEALVSLVTDIFFDLMCLEELELYSLVHDFAVVAGLANGLSMEISHGYVRITSSKALRQRRRVTVDVTVKASD